MSTQPRRQPAYADPDSLAAMTADCQAAGRNLRLEAAARRAVRPAPSIHFADQPKEQAKPTIEISAAAARLAGALHFHLE